MPSDTTPILVGAGQFTQRTAQKGQWRQSMTPMEMVVQAARLAAGDTGLGEALLAKADNISVVGFTADGSEVGRLPVGQYKNPPRTVAMAFGAKPDKEYYTYAGGNTPQMLVNRTADEIARGETQIALLAGAEDLATMVDALNEGEKLDWGDDPGGEPTMLGTNRRGASDVERAHNMYFPVNTYPLFENAIRGQKGRSVEEHLKKIGELFSRFSKVASENPHAWFPTYRSPEEIATPTDKNRWIGFPYTKYMNAIIRIDMAAAVVMTNVKTAREMGIDESKWVYLHGCADANEIWNVSERENLYSSPAIRMMGRKAFTMANLTADDIDFIDLYSCFPSAVQLGAQELGFDIDDPRGLTVTGGLPYFGGAGNNYVMHSIVTMVDRVRENRGKFGLVTANGWYVTKHAIGIYSTKPVEGTWQREDPATYQAEIDAGPRVEVALEPSGEGKIETYTVVHNRKGPHFSIVLGRLNDGRRFIAHTPPDEATLRNLMEVDSLGRPGTVSVGDGHNIFVPA